MYVCMHACMREGKYEGQSINRSTFNRKTHSNTIRSPLTEPVHVLEKRLGVVPSRHNPRQLLLPLLLPLVVLRGRSRWRQGGLQGVLDPRR
jgi:hypothetical protein